MFALRTMYIILCHSKNHQMNIISDDHNENRKGWEEREAVILILETDVVLSNRLFLYYRARRFGADFRRVII